MRLKKKVLLLLIFISLCLPPSGCGDNDSGNNKYSTKGRELNDTTDTASDGTTSDSETATADDSETSDACSGGTVNECGGCASLGASENDPCGECGEYKCNTDGGLDCVSVATAVPRCSADESARQTCNNGQWTDHSCSTGLCHEAICVECIPNTVKCIGSTDVESRCEADGSSWGTSTNCANHETCEEDYGCVTCIPGATKCNDTSDGVFECNDAGSWEGSDTACGASSYCSTTTGTCVYVSSSLHKEDGKFELHPPSKHPSLHFSGNTSLEELFDTAAGFKIG